MSAPDFILPPDNYPPFAVVTATDHTAWILVTTSLGLSFAVLAIIQSSIVLGACANGLGKSVELVSAANQDKVQQMLYTSGLFFIISLGLSKISVAFLLLRLTPHEHHRRILLVTIGLMTGWIVASLFSIALQCDFSHPWISLNTKCPRVFLRWQLISVFDIFFELALIAMTILLVWDLRTDTESKMSVIFAFSMRLPSIVLIGYRLATFNSEGLTTNPGFLKARFIVWTQSELYYSIITATIPSIRPFINTLASSYGANITQPYTSGSGNAFEYPSRTHDYQLRNLRTPSKVDNNDYQNRLWPQNKNESEIVVGNTNGSKNNVGGSDTISVDSVDSKRMIIRKDITRGSR
ncbi:hypothetical protein F5884DRAFT_845384 [Xylogone sp. PMI_703]|nr:hypothetical protein F5884DRAFT_845384 [Xylogone sp. PMI_703]